MSDELFKKAEEHSFLMHEKNFNWMRTVLTLLIPSLVLLIGLKAAPPADQLVARYLLVATIILITLTSLIGLFALRAESLFHDIAHRTFLMQALTKGAHSEVESLEIPQRYYLAVISFPYLAVACLLLVSAFGVVKTLGLG